MKMVTLAVNPGHSFNIEGKHVGPGDEFEAPEEDAVKWELFGFATRVVKQRGRPRKTEKDEPSNSYNRSDLRAED